MELRSPVFGAGEKFPRRYSADGERMSPPLEWSDVPPGTRELAVKLEDVDAREPRPFILWLLYKIPGDQRGLPEGIKHRSTLEEPVHAVQGQNSLEGVGYQPPGAPFGRRHRLYFHLYALDAPLPDRVGLTEAEFRQATDGHVLAEATLPTFYVREER